MLSIEKIIEKDGKIVCKTNQGILKENVAVKLDPEYVGELNPFFLEKDKIYIIHEILKNFVYGDVTVFLKDHYEEPIYYNYLNIVSPTLYNLYKWKGYYILAESIDQAQLIWEKSGLSEKESDDLLFPKKITNIKSESIFPSIIDKLDWDNVIFEFIN